MNTKMITGLIVGAIFIVIVIAAVFQFTKPKDEATRMTDKAQSESSLVPQQPVQENAVAVQEKQSATVFDPAKKYTATLKTDKGDIIVEFNSKQTPKTVENFITLARKGFYDGTIFHRAIKGFMIQGGDPKGDGTGGPGYKFNDESFDGEYTRGTLAMANSGPNTNGSQFFIMHQDYALPKNYVIFGHVLKGLDVVDAIASAPVAMSSSGEQSKPVAPVKILSVTISE